MQRTYSVSADFTAEVLRAFSRLNFRGGENAHRLRDSTLIGRRIHLQEFNRFLDEIHQLNNTPNIGLMLGQELQPSCFDVLGHLVMACNTVGEALAYVPQLQSLVIDCAEAKCTYEQGTLQFEWYPYFEGIGTKQNQHNKLLIDLILSSTRTFGVWATGISDAFSNVKFQYLEPPNTSMYKEVFGHSGTYNCATNGFSIPSSWMDRPIRSANPYLKPVIHDHAQHLLKQLQNTDTHMYRLVEVINMLMPAGKLNIETVAQALYITPRTLQRHLKRHSTNFSEVLKNIRLERSNFFLENTELSLLEISFRLGYREQSSFSTAYKSWTGVSPNEVRELRIEHKPSRACA